MNFTAGRYLPPSKNAAAQPSLFQRTDPYARNQPFSVRQALGGNIPGAAPSAIANGVGPGPQAAGGQIPGEIPVESQVERILQASAGLMPGPTGEAAPTALDALRLLQEQKFGVPDPSTPVSTTPGAPTVAASDLALAARTVLEGVQGNPFITPEGKKALARGGVPAFNQINPAFYRYSSPTVIQALTALYPMTQLFSPEDPAFFANLFRPRGF